MQHHPPERPIRPLKGECPFCNESTAELWVDDRRADLEYQVRCVMCGARGPWSDERGAVDAWRGVAATEL
jgi:hypothetical protein